MNPFKSLRKENTDFAVIDSTFPQKIPLGFRNAEINEYMRRIKNFKSYAISEMGSEIDISRPYSFGISYAEFKKNLGGYLKLYPQNAGRIKYLDQKKNYDIKLAYSFFLAETYVLLPFYEKHQVPFVFVLYPGGRFGLNFSDSDKMLKKIFSSQFFRGVIVTQKITHDYLINKKLCPVTKIHFIYGGIVQFHKNDVLPKRYFKKDKLTFDICFVAAKYSDKGVDKGYDLFIETAELLSSKYDDMHFHVVGGFDKNDINVSKIRNITFYGYKQPDSLPEFYSGMDIFLSPNRPFKLAPGNFDGFPLGNDSQYCGVAMFASDELHMNQHYTDGEDIVIVPINAKKIAFVIGEFYSNPRKLYKLSRKGQLTTQRLFDINYQIDRKIKVFSKFIKLELA